MQSVYGDVRTQAAIEYQDENIRWMPDGPSVHTSVRLPRCIRANPFRLQYQVAGREFNICNLQNPAWRSCPVDCSPLIMIPQVSAEGNREDTGN